MVLYLGPATVEALLAIRPEEAVIDAVTPVFNLHPDTIRRRLQQAARAAGLPGWRDITGHSGRVGMAQDLSAAGFALPELMTAGRWKSPRMPARCVTEKCQRTFSAWGAMPQRETSPLNRANLANAPSASSSSNSCRSAAWPYSASAYPPGSMAW